MADVKLTKNELRAQQVRLKQLDRYLPTLQLKKAMLQAEVMEARVEIERLNKSYDALEAEAREWAPLLTLPTTLDPSAAAVVLDIKRRHENIAGVDVYYLDSLNFKDVSYSLFETPPWVDDVVIGVRKLKEKQIEREIAREKLRALEKELREVSIRVNLFEKVLIPRAKENIKAIKVFLGDQALAAVSQAKVAKSKIEKRKKAEVACA